MIGTLCYTPRILSRVLLCGLVSQAAIPTNHSWFSLAWLRRKLSTGVVNTRPRQLRRVRPDREPPRCRQHGRLVG
ncbi:hypothetical protein cgR_5016 [Corynebacterium glutamicum R]|uniref:Secreted protein n=1 Tax=Corynebacterium glutamicum (strain R) TaxID=340322 RepID=A0AB72VA31_CORGB|nr:hypothetical protein cgR_5016 [Corynebacterium glutamicum R]